MSRNRNIFGTLLFVGFLASCIILPMANPSSGYTEGVMYGAYAVTSIWFVWGSINDE